MYSTKKFYQFSWVCIFLLVVPACQYFQIDPSVQSYEINEHKGKYFLKTESSRRILSRHDFANEAIDRAIVLLDKGGGRIHMGKGTFRFSNPVKLDHKLHITGEGVSTVIVPSKEFEGSNLLFGKALNQVSMAELTLKSEHDHDSLISAIKMSECGSCLFKDLTIIDFSGYGIWLTDDCFLSEIRGCNFADIRGSGVFLDQLNGIGRAGPYIPNLVSNCIFYRGGTGIECSEAIVANIVACMVFQSRGPAFHINNESNSILISGCRTFQIQDDAVVVDNSHEINITGNIFCWQNKNGIVLRSVDWGTVTGNNIIDSGNIPFEFENGESWEYWQERPESMEAYKHTGLVIQSSCKGLTISGNAIFNWASNPPLLYGIHETEDCQDNVIIGNNINYFTEAGILASGRGTITANNLASREAHRGNTDEIHSFDTRLIEKYIEDIK